jgi:hypothetical protein
MEQPITDINKEIKPTGPSFTQEGEENNILCLIIKDLNEFYIRYDVN